MTSFRQIEANRRNAVRSTGPNTEDGKHRSRRNAVRHGLCAETVIDIVEDVEDYTAFEAAVIADYDAHTAVERELVLRLASLLWRLRRATAIETELFRIQAEILRDRRNQTQSQGLQERPQAIPFRIIESRMPLCDDSADDWNEGKARRAYLKGTHTFPISASRDMSPRELAHCFQRLVNFNNDVFERLGRYEVALWRQMLQTMLMLQAARRR